MALSNLFREPRREIIESVMGIAPLGVYLTLDYFFAVWFHRITIDYGGGCPIPFGMIIGGFFSIFLFCAALAAHSLGESICGALARRGLELRPRTRY